MNDRILKALRGEAIDRPPVWFMRQAGRYLPEYRAVRADVSFLELCGDPDLACEVTLQPLRRFELDAAIVFSDILPVLEAMGREIQFGKGMGPQIPEPVRTEADAASLRQPDVAKDLWVAPETIRRFRKAAPDTPIFGFAGAPWTLFCYLVEGSGSKNWVHPKQMIFQQPALAHHILGMIADAAGDYLQLQIDAGAAAVQLFDTWAGVLAPDDLQTFALPYAKRALDRVKGAPRLYFMKDNGPVLHLLPTTGADAFGIDWRTDLAAARAVLGDTPLQGNLDPLALFAPPEVIHAKARHIMEAAGPRGHIFNLGHGVIPATPIDGVHAMIEAVHRYGPEICAR